jgi:hypothetical protein
MLTRFSTVVILATAVFNLATVSEASAQAKRGKRDFKAFDTNNDGRISPSEWKLKSQSRELAPQEMVDRSAIDTDGDGYLSADRSDQVGGKETRPKAKANARTSRFR